MLTRKDLSIIKRLYDIEAERINDETIINLSEDQESIRVKDIHSLDLSFYDLETLPKAINKLTGLQSLVVRATLLTSLPDSIGELKNLESLDVRRTQLKSLPDRIGELKNLESLDVRETQLTSLPDRIGELKNLESLDVSSTQLTSLPDRIGELKNLESLDVRGTQLTSLPDSIGELESLKYLYVSYTELTSLPDSIGELKNLESLDVSSTQLTSLPDSIGELESLKNLYVSNTELTSLPDSIGELKNLESLDVSSTQLTNLPDSIGELENLESLDVGGTQLTRLPASINTLRNLSRLDIGGTKIKKLNVEMFELPAIKKIVLEELTLDRIPKEFLWTELDFIFLDYGFYGSKPFDGIYINNLSLAKQPISLFYQKRKLIEQYFNEEMISVNSAKIIFLGDGEVGKTYTLKRLLNDGKKATDEITYPTKTTHGVLIKPLKVAEGDVQYDIKLWDFGGQQIMHSMHRCFLTERSCYVVMLSTRTDRDLMEQARYWLRTVESFAPNSPIIVLVNQWTKNQIKVDEIRLRQEFGNISEFLYFSVVEADDEVFLKLKSSIMEQVRRLDSYGMEFPKSWYGLMTDLEKESHNYISKTTYHQMCFERGLKYEDNNEEGIYEWLLDWFNDLGVCFSYHKNSNSQKLDNYELLNPQWLTRAAYVLINNGEPIAENGILKKAQIEEILKNTDPLDFDDLGVVSYKSFEIEYILEILRKFRISYQLPDGRELIPVLCSENSSGNTKPEWFVPSEMKHTSYELQYEYLPDTIIHRLMIFCYQSHYNVRDRWRKGMRVDFNNDEFSSITAVVDSGSGNQSITIDIYSDGSVPCWTMLKKLRDEILCINMELNLKAKDYIVMETEGIKDKFSVDAVLKRRARGKKDYPAEKYDGDYEISEILGSAYGAGNAAVIEKILESSDEVLTVERTNQIIDDLVRLRKALEGLTERSKNIESQVYQTKDMIADKAEIILKNQEVSEALLNVLTKKPSAIKKLLSGGAIAADLITLVESTNPGLTEMVVAEVAEKLALLLQMIR